MKKLPLIIFLFSSPSLILAECEIGVFLGESPPYKETINKFEDLIGKDIHSVMWYQGWSMHYPLSFPKRDFLEENIRYHDGYNTHTILHITIEPWVDLESIANGAYDSVLKNYAQSCKEWKDEIRIRFGHEMIHDDNPYTYGWYPWQDKPESYKKAFRHIYNIFKDVGADNVKFVWCPNNRLQDLEVNLEILKKYFPGKDYVDWLGIDGYNWGDPQDDFDKLFSIIYSILTEHPEIFGDKPVMLGEFACAEGDFKPEWIKEAFQKIKEKYTKIKAFYWFNAKKERDWRIDPYPESLKAFKEAIKSAYFTSHPLSGEGNQNQTPPPQPTFQNSQSFKVTLRIPQMHTLKVKVIKIENDDWQEVSEINFGRLVYDKIHHIFRANCFYAVDVLVLSNLENWTLTHTTSSVTNGIDNLDNNINVVFVKCTKDSEVELNKCSFKNSNSFSVTKTQLGKSWLRIYYGIATGAGDADDVEVITMNKSPGTYTGTITLTLTP